MKEKREIPVWAIVTSLVVVLGFVGFLFTKAASGGDASKDTLDKIRSNQRKFSTNSPQAPDTSAQPQR
jgi:hypothetical protein